MKRIAILGASGHGKVLADAALLCGWDEIVFFDDAWPSVTISSRWDVIGDAESLIQQNDHFGGVIVAIGNNLIRLEKTKYLLSAGANVISLIHPSAVISNFSNIGLGTFVAAGAIVQIDSTIGDACIINTNAVVEHDCVLGDGVHISPSSALSGGVVVSNNSWIGVGSCVRQLVRIGSNVIVGAGSVVVNDIASELVVVGNPARVLVKNKL